jgi:hypothetical protein
MSDGNKPVESLNVSEWCEVILAALRPPGHPFVPAGPDDEPHFALVKAYNKLPTGEARDRFGTALSRLLEGTPATVQHAAQLFYLVQVISYVKPWQAKPLLLPMLLDGTLQSIEYADRNLHIQVLATIADYSVDEELTDYLLRVDPASVDYRFSLVVLRVLSRSPYPDHTYTFLERLIPTLNSLQDFRPVVRELRGIAETGGYKSLFAWYMRRRAALLALHPDHWDMFDRSLRSRFLQWTPDLASVTDVYKLLLGALLNVRLHQFSADDLLVIAVTIRIAPSDLVKGVLSELWEVAAATFDAEPWSIAPAPWQLGDSYLLKAAGQTKVVGSMLHPEACELLADLVTEKKYKAPYPNRAIPIYLGAGVSVN